MRTIPTNPPRFVDLTARERAQRCVDEWSRLINAYILQVVRHGSRFNRIPVKDLVNPDPICCLRSTYTALAFEDDPILEQEVSHAVRAGAEAGPDPRGHLGVTWGVYLCAGKPPLADIILSHPPDLTRCDSVIGLAIPAMSGHIQNRGAAS